jgi:Tol biopolymer transport system component
MNHRLSLGGARLLSAALAVLVLAVPGARAQQATDGAEFTVRRVWVGGEPDFWAGSPSPDGRYVTDIHWDSGDLAVIDLVSGDLRRVGAKEGGWEEESWVEWSVFSPDGSRIAYVWWEVAPSDSAAANDYNGYSVRTIAVDGGPSRSLVPPEVADYFALFDWSADGGALLAKAYVGGLPDEQNRLVRIRTSDGGLEPIPGVSYELLEEIAGRPVFSPDGRYVAFSRRAGPDNRDLYVVGVESGNARPVLEGQADDRVMDWHPDGLLFYSDRGATSGIWLLPLSADLRPGEPRLLQPDVWRAEPLGLARDALYYGVEVESPQVYIGAIDVANGGYLAPMGPVQEGSSGRSADGEFSPDGRYLAYGARAVGVSGKRGIVVRAVGGDDVRRFDLDEGQEFRGWAADGRALILSQGGADGPHVLRLDLASGQTTTVASLPPVRGPGRLSPDGRWIYALRDNREGKPGAPLSWEIVAINLEDGSEHSVVQARGVFDLSVSPDGSKLAIMDGEFAAEGWRDERVFTVPVSGGSPNVIYEGEGLQVRGGIPWTPDGREVLFVKRGGEGVISSSSIVAVPVDGGPARKLVDLQVKGLHRHFRLSSDGSRFVVNAGQSTGEIWMLDGLSGSKRSADAGSR